MQPNATPGSSPSPFVIVWHVRRARRRNPALCEFVSSHNHYCSPLAAANSAAKARPSPPSSNGQPLAPGTSWPNGATKETDGPPLSLSLTALCPLRPGDIWAPQSSAHARLSPRNATAALPPLKWRRSAVSNQLLKAPIGTLASVCRQLANCLTGQVGGPAHSLSAHARPECVSGGARLPPADWGRRQRARGAHQAHLTRRGRLRAILSPCLMECAALTRPPAPAGRSSAGQLAISSQPASQPASQIQPIDLANSIQRWIQIVTVFFLFFFLFPPPIFPVAPSSARLCSSPTLKVPKTKTRSTLALCSYL